MCNGNGRGGERLYRTNEGDGIRTKSAREGGRERGPVPDLPLSRLGARLLKSHRRSNISRDAISFFFFLIIGIKYSNRLIFHNLTFNAIDVEISYFYRTSINKNISTYIPQVTK